MNLSQPKGQSLRVLRPVFPAGPHKVAKRLECGAFRRFRSAANETPGQVALGKRRNAPHSRRFARFGCRWTALGCSLLLALAGRLALAAPEPNAPLPTNNVIRSEIRRAPDTTDEANSLSTTNELSPIEELLGMTEEPADENAAPDGISSTNGPSGTNNVGEPDEQPPRKSSGRESRSRRYSKQRSSQPSRSADSSSNGASPSGTNTGPASLDYSAFRLIAERNIFDPNRRPSRGERSAPPPPPRNNRDAQYFTLVGTMSYEKGTFAFFTGTSYDYQKALTNAETIAGFKLAAIARDSVRLTHDTNEVDLAVGMQMRLEDDGSWQPRRGATSLAVSAPSNPTPSTSSSATSAASAESDIIKRLMQKREQE
jgi:hypothetical protein